MGVSEDHMLACRRAAIETGVAAERLSRAGTQVRLMSRDLPLAPGGLPRKQSRPALQVKRNRLFNDTAAGQV